MLRRRLPMPAKHLTTHVALLRGINVGGKNELPMAELRRLFETLGCTQVHTYIQSGNVVFSASTPVARSLPAQLSAAIDARFGLQVPITTRTASELRTVATHNPFGHAGVDPRTLHVAFLAGRPSKAQIEALDPNRSPPDRFVARGREIYMHLPNGVARSKLTTKYFDTTLSTITTARNWRTVLTLVELCGSTST